VFAPNPGVGVDGQPVETEKKGFASRLFGGKDNSNAPVTVAKDGIQFAKDKLYDTVIIDTAGRLGVDEELMKQAADIRDAVDPDEVLFVLDATTGQDAINSARAFDEGVGFTAAVLTKFDSDARGGAALSVAKGTGKPILFAGVGEKFEDLEVFHPDRVASRILDQGDILTLLEQAEDKIDEEVALATAQKLVEGEAFDLNDFLAQMNQIKKMGSIKNMLGMIPGMGQHKAAIDNFDEGQLVRIEAIIQSMTPFERANPKKLNGPRKARVAAGSGVEVSAVNQLLTQFTQMQKMMSKMMGGKNGKKMLQQMTAGDDDLDMNNLQDMAGGLSNMLPGAKGAFGQSGFGAGVNAGITGDLSQLMGANRTSSSRKGKNVKKKGKSGNPAKRAQEEALQRAKFGGN
jgi:signal recognition particle subunit SRP54